MGWIIQTLTVDIDKRKAAKTSYKTIEDCIPKLNSIIKYLSKNTKQFNSKMNMFKELISEFAQGLAKNFAEKDAEINSIKKEIEALSNRSTALTYAQTISTNRSRPQEEEKTLRNRQQNRSKSRMAANKKRSADAMVTAPPSHLSSTQMAQAVKQQKLLYGKPCQRRQKPRNSI